MPMTETLELWATWWFCSGVVMGGVAGAGLTVLWMAGERARFGAYAEPSVPTVRRKRSSL